MALTAPSQTSAALAPSRTPSAGVEALRAGVVVRLTRTAAEDMGSLREDEARGIFARKEQAEPPTRDRGQGSYLAGISYLELKDGVLLRKPTKLPRPQNRVADIRCKGLLFITGGGSPPSGVL